MRFTVRVLLVGALASVLALNPALNASGCGPFPPESEIYSSSHPDLPLKLFAEGKFGILPASYARSYLCVVYRYLTGEPLDAIEQAGMVKIWHQRFEQQHFLDYEFRDDPIDRYLKLRARVAGYEKKQFANLYYDAFNKTAPGLMSRITPEAYSLACSTLSNRINLFGLKSNEVKLWLKGQDEVFGIAPRNAGAIPDALPAGCPLVQLQDRKYQIAAATLYQGHPVQAERLFAAIAADVWSPWRALAPYLVLRCKFQTAVDSGSPELINEAVKYITGALGSAKGPSESQPLFDLLTPLLRLQLSPQQFLDHLVNGVLKKHARRFGADVGDLTFVMDEACSKSHDAEEHPDARGTNLDFSQHDLTEWLSTMQQPGTFWLCDDKELEQARIQRAGNCRHALAVWRKKKTLAWLVAAMTGNGLRDHQDLLAAARQIPAQSPAYLTARFYVLDALIAQGDAATARAELLKILSRKDLPPSTRNMFSAELLSVTNSLSEYLHAAMMASPYSMNEVNILPANWRLLEGAKTYSTEMVVFDDAVAEDLNRHLPLSSWMKLCRDKTIDAGIRGRIIRSTWMRSLLVDRPDVARELAGLLALSYPKLGRSLHTWSCAAPGEEQRFASACLVLRNCGLTPYVGSGLERHGVPVDVFNYFNANFWLPLSVEEPKPVSGDDRLPVHNQYPSVVPGGENQLLTRVRANYKPGVSRLLSASETQEALKEREIIRRNHPSRFLGEIVFARARSHPQDSQVPEMLYRIVRLPKWTERTAVGSDYSHRAYLLLHAGYPASVWAHRATCWY